LELEVMRLRPGVRGLLLVRRGDRAACLAFLSEVVDFLGGRGRAFGELDLDFLES